MKGTWFATAAAVAGAGVLLAACGGGGGGGGGNVAPAPVASSYAVGGSVSGLHGTGLALQINGGETVSISADGTFRFPTPLVDKSLYNVTVSAQPSGHPVQACAVVNNLGFVNGGDVATISVNCTTKTFSISGTVSGRASFDPLVLRNNGSDTVVVQGNGTFSFSIALADETGYSV